MICDPSAPGVASRASGNSGVGSGTCGLVELLKKKKPCSFRLPTSPQVCSSRVSLDWGRQVPVPDLRRTARAASGRGSPRGEGVLALACLGLTGRAVALALPFCLDPRRFGANARSRGLANGPPTLRSQRSEPRASKRPPNASEPKLGAAGLQADPKRFGANTRSRGLASGNARSRGLASGPPTLRSQRSEPRACKQAPNASQPKLGAAGLQAGPPNTSGPTLGPAGSQAEKKP